MYSSASAKEGIGTQDILEGIIKHVPPPKGLVDRPLRALVFDSHYDAYKGAIAYVRIVDGTQLRQRRASNHDGDWKQHRGARGWLFQLRLISVGELTTGEVGYIATGFENVKDCHVGDTVTLPEAVGEVETLIRL